MLTGAPIQFSTDNKDCMKRFLLIILLLSVYGCSEEPDVNLQEIKIADSLYWSFFSDKKPDNLYMADSILQTISTNDDRCLIRLAKINFVLGNNNKAADCLAKVSDSYFNDDYRKLSYITALHAFSKYSEKDSIEAKRLLNEAISIIDSHLVNNSNDSLAVGMKYIIKRQIFDIDIEQLNNEIDQLPYTYLIYDIKNSYPAKLHYRFYNSSHPDFPCFLLEELDK